MNSTRVQSWQLTIRRLRSTLLSLAGLALLIRDAASFGLELGQDPTTLLDSAAEVFRDYRAREGTPYVMGLWLDMLWLRSELEEAALQLDSLSLDELTAMELPAKMSVVKILVALHRYASAFDLLCARGMEKAFHPSNGPLRKLATIYEWMQGSGKTAADHDGFVRFARSLKDRVTEKDWGDTEPVLSELEKLALGK
ncbi:MAG: hypothetical protein AB1486_09290 [Planctomycetota bacterium]